LPDLDAVRGHADAERESLPEALKTLNGQGNYPVTIAAPVRSLAAAVDRRTAPGPAGR
jgi:hypothetical protein